MNMGAKTGDDDQNFNDAQQPVLKEELLKSLANRDGIIYEPPSEKKFVESPIRHHQVETGD